MVLGAYLAGHEIVGDCMADEKTRAYMSQALFNEIMPTLDLPKDDLEAFASAIFERFENPFNRHLLLSISLNSQSKFRARVLPTIREYVKRKGDIPAVMQYMQQHYPAPAKHYLVADVCRPELLIEIEGVAKVKAPRSEQA
jgi:tagaturonate reductase